MVLIRSTIERRFGNDPLSKARESKTLKALDLTSFGVLSSTTYSSRKSETAWRDLSSSKSNGVVPQRSRGFTSENS